LAELSTGCLGYFLTTRRAGQWTAADSLLVS